MCHQTKPNQTKTQVYRNNKIQKNKKQKNKKQLNIYLIQKYSFYFLTDRCTVGLVWTNTDCQSSHLVFYS